MSLGSEPMSVGRSLPVAKPSESSVPLEQVGRTVSGEPAVAQDSSGQPTQPLIQPSTHPLAATISKPIVPVARGQVSILMVDDRDDKLLALEATLEPLGHNLVKAKSGKEALRILLKQEFAVILLDVSMPGMDGFETAAL